MIEYRTAKTGAVTDEKGVLVGLVTPFNTKTVIGDLKRGGFREENDPGAFTKTLQEQDIVLIHNHDTGMPMARTSVPFGEEGGLSLAADPDAGLRAEAIPVDTTYAGDVMKLAKAKVLKGMSYGFEVIRDEWTDDEGRASDRYTGTNRRILEARIHEVTTTAFPAYKTTELSARDAINAARGIEGARAAKATYADLDTCGECGATGQYGRYCAQCGEPMGQDTVQTPYCPSCGQPTDGERSHECYDIRADKPYGDVEYADPKNGKYPIDTKKHVIAAWDYIHVQENADEYPLNGVTLASVKSKIKAAAGKFGVTLSEKNSEIPAPEKRDDPDGIEWAAMFLAIKRIEAGDTEGAVKALQDALPEDYQDENDSPSDGERSEPAQTTPEIDAEELRAYYRAAYGV